MSHPPPRHPLPTTLSARGLAKPGLGRGQCSLRPPCTRAQARNESYRYGRIRRKMPPDAAVHTHAFDKARSGQQQAARRREASGPARLLPPHRRPRGTCTGPSAGPAEGSGRLLPPGPPHGTRPQGPHASSRPHRRPRGTCTAQRGPGRGEQVSPSAGAPAARGPPTATFRLPTCQSQPA